MKSSMCLLLGVISVILTNISVASATSPVTVATSTVVTRPVPNGLPQLESLGSYYSYALDSIYGVGQGLYADTVVPDGKNQFFFRNEKDVPVSIDQAHQILIENPLLASIIEPWNTVSLEAYLVDKEGYRLFEAYTSFNPVYSNEAGKFVAPPGANKFTLKLVSFLPVHIPGVTEAYIDEVYYDDEYGSWEGRRWLEVSNGTVLFPKESLDTYKYFVIHMDDGKWQVYQDGYRTSPDGFMIAADIGLPEGVTRGVVDKANSSIVIDSAPDGAMLSIIDVTVGGSYGISSPYFLWAVKIRSVQPGSSWSWYYSITTPDGEWTGIVPAVLPKGKYYVVGYSPVPGQPPGRG